MVIFHVSFSLSLSFGRGGHNRRNPYCLLCADVGFLKHVKFRGDHDFAQKPDLHNTISCIILLQGGRQRFRLMYYRVDTEDNVVRINKLFIK